MVPARVSTMRRSRSLLDNLELFDIYLFNSMVGLNFGSEFVSMVTPWSGCPGTPWRSPWSGPGLLWKLKEILGLLCFAGIPANARVCAGFGLFSRKVDQLLTVSYNVQSVAVFLGFSARPQTVSMVFSMGRAG